MTKKKTQAEKDQGKKERAEKATVTKVTPDPAADVADVTSHYCAQRGCEFESVEVLELCPGCGHPFIEHPDPGSLAA